MNKYLVPLICGLLLSGPVAALTPEQQADVDKNVAINLRANKLLIEAESRAMAQCGTTRIVVPLPGTSPETDTNFHTTWVDITIETAVSIEWTGACEEGSRDGEGVLSWTEETDHPRGLTTFVVRRAEGRFVNGRRLGLWCETKKWAMKNNGQITRESTVSGCTVLAGHDNLLTAYYRKQPDGRWQELVAGSPTDSFLAAGALETQSAKVLADAAAGKTDLKVELVIHNQSLDDLVRGSKIVFAPSAAPIALKNKRVAIVLSSRTIREMERFKHERQVLIDASAGSSGETAKERAKFIQASNPDRLLVNILKVVKKYAKDTQPADDLSGLRKGGFDYALVVDWKSMTRFDLLGKYDSFPRLPIKDFQNNDVEARTAIAVAGDSLGGFLIDRDLKAVKQAAPFPGASARPPQQFDDSTEGDQAYLRRLAGYFVYSWGDDAHEIGFPVKILVGNLMGE